ncbi:MAG TPA: alpha/beta hydrolase-fold protein, partial [Aquaticitalea sp.]|nr:alpha/beta hydrolase-fold protein [Aquaticitalea sp.]
MVKSIINFILVLAGFNAFAQVTIVVNQLPENTPNEASVFISGDFEGWSGGQTAFQLTKAEDTFYMTLPKQEAPINFKFTLGSWESVECDAKGNSTGNRTYKFDKPDDTLRFSVAGWTHLFDKKVVSTAADNVSILSENFKIPQLDRERRVWMYLPPNYENSTESFPVVYMHDGQNIFDTTTSYSGEWEIDETLNQLYEERGLKLIVVGVDNGGSKRLDEYSPWKNEKYGGGEGEAYVDFLVHTLKPYIDSHFRTLPDKANTAIVGSSMGGLISHYAALKYPKVFGKVGVYSPAFWFAPEINDFTKEKGNITDTKMYFLAGGMEGENAGFNEINQTVKDMNAVVDILKNQGFPSEQIKSKVEPDGKHNEQLWRNNFEEAITWLFSEKITSRDFKKSFVKDNQLHVEVTDGLYNIQFYNSEIVETSFIPKGETFNAKSHAVVLIPEKKLAKLTETDSTLVYSLKDFTVKIDKEPFKISYWFEGEQVISERNGYQKNSTHETIQFSINKDEVLYGSGARALGMNRRGHRLQLYNKAHYGYETRSELMNFTLPIVLSSKQYLMHFDNAPIGYLDLDSKQNNTLTYETISGRKTYQVVVGDSWYDLLDNYTDLTGKQPLPPRWALGNFSSRFGYHSQEEVLKTIQKFKEDNIRVDAIILDLYWFGKEVMGTMGNLEFDKDSFPNPKQMIKTLREQNVETILITEPFVLTTSKRWDEAVAKNALAKDSLGNPFTYDFFFGNTGLVDVYSESGYTWFK